MFKADGQHMIPRDRVVDPLSRFKDEEFGYKINLYPLEWLCFLLL